MWPTDGGGAFEDEDVDALHAEGFGHPVLPIGWRRQVEQHSLGWVCAYDGERLVGFVNVAWDGGVHAFVLDTLVGVGARHEGIGRGLSGRRLEGGAALPAASGSTSTSQEELRGFYLDACGFAPTPAGVIALRGRAAG